MNETIEKHDTLNPALFDGEELKPEVKEAVKNIADEFIKNLEEDEIKAILKDIVLIGSNVSYNYNPDSDLDIHLIVDSNALECPPSLTDKLYGAYRCIFNKNYDISIKGIPAEVYVELDKPKAKSNGIYSINTGWIKKPEPKDIPEIDQEAFEALFSQWEDRYFGLVGGKGSSEEELNEAEEDKYYSCSVYGGYDCQELLADNIEIYAKDEDEAKKEAMNIYKQEYNYSEEDNPFGLKVEINNVLGKEEN